MRYRLATVAFLLLAFVACHAQTPATYRIPLSVVTEKGAAVEDLPASSVQVHVGGQRANVLSVKRYYNAQVRMVIVLDESGSMQTHWSDAITFVVELLKSVPPGSSVGLLGASEAPAELITKPESIINALKNVSGRGPAGRTPLWDSIHEALRMLPHPRPSDLIVVVTDGGDNVSKMRQYKVVEELHAAGVRVSGFLLYDPSGASSMEEEQGAGDLVEMIQASGGRTLNDRTFLPESIYISGPRADRAKYGPLMAKFFHALYDFYIVEFTLPEPLTKPARLKVEAHQTGAKWSVAAPKILAPAQP